MMLGVPLMLKKWNPMFDAEKEKSHWGSIWVHLPQLPIHFWNVESFELIGNYLGKFLEADNYAVHGRMCKGARQFGYKAGISRRNQSGN